MDEFRLINQVSHAANVVPEKTVMTNKICAGGFIVMDGKFLFGKRSRNKDWAPGLWDIVGGKALKYENPIFTLQRETFEEIGVSILNADLMVTADVLKIKSGKTVFTYYIYMITDFKGRISNKSWEHTKLRWFTREELETTALALPEYLTIIDEWNFNRR